jgi:hypothetical protein
MLELIYFSSEDSSDFFLAFLDTNNIPMINKGRNAAIEGNCISRLQVKAMNTTKLMTATALKNL